MAEAAEDSLLCVITADNIEHLVLRRPEVGLRMLRFLGQRLKECEDRLEEVAFHSAPARLASFLLRLATGGIVKGMTHQDMADTLGVYRETVTKILDGWAREGFVELGRRRILLLRKGALAAIAAVH